MAIPIPPGAGLGLLTDTPGTLPNMSDTISNWFQLCTFTVITKTVINLTLVETPTVVSFMGVIEAISGEHLNIKPEGQRSWDSINVWALPSLDLKTDDKIVYDGKTYRVMDKNDWNKYGYVQYSATEDYT